MQMPNEIRPAFNITSVFIAAIIGCQLHVSQAFASQKSETDNIYDLSLEELTQIIVGSRRSTQLSTSISPVDIIHKNELRSQASINVPDMLRKLILSFNVGDHPLSGVSTAVRPASMRGLSPDHLLVLINGKRLHRSAQIPTFSGGITDGSQGTDLKFIPAIALKEVQVLRNGAAAQYGADAVAGVINFVLNDNPGKNFDENIIELKIGATYAGDVSPDFSTLFAN